MKLSTWYVEFSPLDSFRIFDLLNTSTEQSYDERTALIHFIRTTLDQEGLTSTPIVAGVGGSSTRETIQLARTAAEAGA